jgi:hypothetical protein
MIRHRRRTDWPAMKRLNAPAKVALALFVSAAMMLTAAQSAYAAPTSDFTFSPTAPAVSQPVTFTFTGSCDLEPCRIQWRWFTPDGNRLGTSMGEGPVLSYAFSRVAVYSVVAKITNSSRLPDSASMTHTVAVTSTFQDDRRSVGYSSWRGVISPIATGGGYRVGSGSPAIASMSFSGTQISYVGIAGPDQGVALVTVDGAPGQPVDLYSATPARRNLAISGLPDAGHTIVVRASGGKNPASTGTAISLDEFVAGVEQVNDTSLRVSYDGWAGVSRPSASGGGYRVTSTPNATATLTFGGTSIRWLTSTGPNQGQASIAIDAGPAVVVDNYSAVRSWKVGRSFTGLAAGVHTITVTVLGTSNPLSAGTAVINDAFVVG